MPPRTASVDASWIDLVLADDEWVRQEFDELIAHGWGGSGALRPPTGNRSHEPRRSRPRQRPTQRRFAAAPGSAPTQFRTPARAPPG